MTTIRRSLDQVGPAQHWRVSKRADAITRALGKRIRHLRKVKGWSQEFLADKAGMHRTYLWGVEQGVRNPSVRQVAQIAEALNVPLASLFEQS